MLIRILRIWDHIVLILAGVVSTYRYSGIFDDDRVFPILRKFDGSDFIGFIVLVIGWIAISDYLIRYQADRWVELQRQLKCFVIAAAGSLVWFVLVCPVFWVGIIKADSVLIFFGLVTLVGIFTRIFLHLVLLSARKSGYNFRYLLIIGATDRAYEVGLKIDDKPELGYKIVGFVAESHDVLEAWPKERHCRWETLGVLVNLRDILVDARADELMICLPVESRFSEILNIVRHARDLGIVVRLMPDPANSVIFRNLVIEKFEDDCVVTLFREQLLAQLMAKRLIDAVLSVVILTALAPLMVLVSLMIKLTSPGPVFFAQKRVGMNQRLFVLYKFRSMVAGAEQMMESVAHLNDRDGPAFKIIDDPRITRIGRFLRRTSLDELPQLLNVIRGEMSLVGPRPPLPEEVRRYAWLFRKRLSVKPGVTCIWQISGRNNVSFDRWMEMDHEYIENWSLWLDLKILFLTVPVVLLSKGAS
jgi:exopolysaccharide biosynthesis polyprenyl glycosylphosphotransferase